MWLGQYCHPGCSLAAAQQQAKEELQALFYEHADPLTECGDDDEADTMALGLATASMMPAFASGLCDAVSWLGSALQGSDTWTRLPCTAELLRASQQVLTKWPDWESWQLAGREDALRERLEAIAGEARGWEETARNAHKDYRYANDTLREIADHPPVADALRIVVLKASDERDGVQRFVDDLKDDGRLAQLVQDFYRRALPAATRKTKPPLVGPADRGVRTHVRNLVRLAGNWLETVDSIQRLGKQSWLNEPVSALRDKWIKVWPSVWAELAELPVSGARARSGHILRRQLQCTILTLGREVMGYTELPTASCLPPPQTGIEGEAERVTWLVPDWWKRWNTAVHDEIQPEAWGELAQRLAALTSSPPSDDEIVSECAATGFFDLARIIHDRCGGARRGGALGPRGGSRDWFCAGTSP
jgi:hypothetical protein